MKNNTPPHFNKLVDFYRKIPEKNITFDITGRCNFRCQMCVWHNGKKANELKQDMDFKWFKDNIKQLLKNRIHYKNINISVSGEPTMHKNFTEIVKFLFDSNKDCRLFDVLSINTNMFTFDEQVTDLLLSALNKNRGRLFLTCSLNAASEETSKIITKANAFKRTVANTEYLISQKSKLKLGDKLKIDLQMLILKDNEHEYRRFRDYWSEVFKKAQLEYAVVADDFHPSDNVINFKREFDQYNQKECDARFMKVRAEILSPV